MNLKKTFHKLLLLVLVTATIFSPLFIASAYNKTSAQNYLESHANNPWAVMGLVALGNPPAGGPDVDFLKTYSGNAAIDYAAPILALAAAGKNPKTFPADDFTAKLKTFHKQNQIGDVSTVNDDIFGILALISAGEPANDAAITDAKNFIIANQKPNGGWGFAVSGGADSNITAAAIVALKAVGEVATSPTITKALDYLKTAQNDDGGFTYDPVGAGNARPSDSSSTAWAMWALNAVGEVATSPTWTKNGHTPSEYLSSTQHQSGYFEWQAGSGENAFSAANTAYAVIALEGKSLPLNTPSSPSLPLFPFRIEGSQETICEGKTQGPTALDIIKNASAMCDFTFHIKDTSFGPYLDKINNDEAGGTQGWLYWVNFNSPSVGAADYQLQNNDEVLWAFGNFDIKPLNLSLDKTEINSGENAMASVGEVATSPTSVKDADVVLGASQFKTGNDGKTQVSGPDGYYKVFAKKDGFVRSNKILLKIGNPSSSSVNLSVNVQTGSVAGTSTPPSTIGFTIEPSSLDFGTLNAGQSANKTLKLKNTGSVNLQFESEVAQGQLFKDNLKLEGKLWKQFKKEVSAQTSQDVQASLTIPVGAASGQQIGKLIFWASPK